MSIIVDGVEKRRVILSVAHGIRPEHGKNNYDGVTEYEFSKAITPMVRDLLLDGGFGVTFFDHSAENPELDFGGCLIGKKNRANQLDPEKDDLLVEIHLNSPQSKKGACVLFAAGSYNGELAATRIMDCLGEERGVHWTHPGHEPGAIPVPGQYRNDRPTLLWRTVSVAVLIEVDAIRFIKDLMAPDYLKRLANVLTEGIACAATIYPEDDYGI